jgi:hypothetical protein
MHYLQLFFRDREKPILVPVVQETVNRLLECFTDRTDQLGFFEFGSVVEHDIWANGARLQMVRFLSEADAPPFDPTTIGSSQQFPEKDQNEPQLDDVLWQVTFWLRGRDEPVTVFDISGHDWVEIYTSCDFGEQFLVVSDEDGEELALRIDEIDMISGIELKRYSESQLEAVAGVIRT